ncbi:MAG: portal protein [Candidatus Actinomarinaceae bacterium]
MAERNPNLFQRLTRLFRSGPVVKRNVLRQADNKTSTAFETFRKNQSTVYSAAMSAYGTYDRMARYSDFSEMEYTPEIASALDIYAEESVAADENGTTLHIYSENSKIKEILTELFYDTLNVEFNMTAWVRNLVKYGDFFLFNDVHPEYGVINAYPLPISEIEREEGFDPNDPMAVRFRWITQGNQVLENWQISHMRLLGNDAFLPYGSSVLEPARRIWRQLILLEDAMLVYRIVRAPERRVFKIDVGNVPPEDIANYMEQAQSSLKRAPVVDKSTGKVDLRYNPLSVDEDYFIPVRGADSGTAIDTLGGGTMAGETNDVEYIQKKLFSALKIPKAYLGYDEGLGAKATLSQEDIRFSRTIARIQRTILSEMNKIAIVHLYCQGFTDEDLLDFKLKLSNPSTIAQQQKLELFRTRFEVAQSALSTPGLVNRKWVQKNIMRLSDEEIKAVRKGLVSDKVRDLELESTQIGETEGPEVSFGGNPPPGAPMPGIDLGGTPDPPPADLPPLSEFSIEDESAPIKAQNMIDRNIAILSEEVDEVEEDKDLTEFELWQKKHQIDSKIKRSKAKHKEDAGIEDIMSYKGNDGKFDVSGMPRLMSDLGQLKNPVKNIGKSSILKEEDFDIAEYLDNKVVQNAKITGRIQSTLKRFDLEFGKPASKGIIISENNSSEDKE